VSDDNGSCLIGAAAAGFAPKSNLLTGALVATGAGLSIPGMRMAPVTGARGGAAAGAEAAAGRGWSIPGMRMGVTGDGAGALATGSSGAGLVIGASVGLSLPGEAAISFASSAIRSSDLSAGSDICCGLAGGMD
jgi:hypothetical protein